MNKKTGKITLALLTSLFLFQACEKDKVFYSLVVNPSLGYGTVNSDYKVQYEAGKVVIVEATPDLYYYFSSWIGDVNSTDNPLTIIMNENIEITPVFKMFDADGDGVPDELDQCPDTEEGIVVDSKGCERASLIILAENGITVMAGEESVVGDSRIINDKLYTVVDEEVLRKAVKNQEDVSGMITSKITDMSGLFSGWKSFNQDISSWDVSNVTDMAVMFGLAIKFNQDISSWDVSNVTDMRAMFSFANIFNQDIGSWNVSNVTMMSNMFEEAKSFNQDIGSWDVSNVTVMHRMFRFAMVFNQDLSSWDVSNVTEYLDFASSAVNWVLPKPDFK